MTEFPSLFNNEFTKSPFVICDVGARGGLQDHWKKHERFLKTVLIEPEPKAYDELMKVYDPSRQLVIGVPLYSENKQIKFYITKAPGCSSIYYPNKDSFADFPENDAFDILRTETFMADTLDNQLSKHKVHLDFLKLDTQGSELDILKGAKESLTNDIFGIELEVEFVELYENQPLFTDVDHYVRSLGFQLFDLRHTYWKRDKYYPYGGHKGQLIFADALYFKKASVFNSQVKKQVVARQKGMVLRAIFQSCIYGYLDYAVTIFEEYGELFTDQEKAAFMAFLNQNKGSYYAIPYFKGRYKLMAWIESLQKAISPSHKGWAFGVKHLGNR